MQRLSVELGEVNKNKKTRIVLKLFGSDSLTLGHKKTGKVHGKSHGKSWNLKSSKELRTLL